MKNAYLYVITSIIVSDVAHASQLATEELTGDREFDPRPLQISVEVGSELMFDSNIEFGGEVSVNRFGFGFGITDNIDRDTNLTLSFGYGLDSYDFSSSTGLGPDPWGDIHTLGGGAIISFDLTNTLTTFGGPVIQFSRESGGEWKDSIMGGGVIGFVFEFSKELRFGGGFGAVTQIEEDARLFPVIVVDWEISDTLRLSSQTTTGASGRQGIELVWNPVDRWEFGVGGANEFARFRLDNDGTVPKGVGEDQSMPLWFRASYGFSNDVRVSGLVGFHIGGEMELFDQNGNSLVKRDYDDAMFLGIFGHIRF